MADEEADQTGESLGIQVHEGHEEHNPFHDHVDFVSTSLISARLCLGCGAFVAGSHLRDHQVFHDQLREALVRASGADTATPDEVPLF